LPSESETKKRQRIQEMKEFEGGRRCLSPSIFRKSKGPIIFATSSSSITTNVVDGSRNFQPAASFKGRPGTLSDPSVMAKDISIQDYDINQAMGQKDLHSKS
jgi:hypothetical protein